MNLKQMEDYVISPALKVVGLHSPEASRLILLTGVVESRYEYVAQVGGPARSFWQVEPTTMFDHYRNYIKYRPDFEELVTSIFGEPSIERLCLSMGFAVVMARLVYRRSPDLLPSVDNLPGQARIWKKVYNTELGAGTVEKFIEMCQGLEI